jgi:hypothetical protein
MAISASENFGPGQVTNHSNIRIKTPCLYFLRRDALVADMDFRLMIPANKT